MIKFYDILLTALKPLIVMIGKLHWPFAHKKITGKHYFKLRDSIDIGTIFLTKTRGEISNLVNPTELKHGGIYLGDFYGDGIRYVLEAVGTGVVITDLVTFMTTKDVLVISKPVFIRNESDFNSCLKEFAVKVNGLPYDYLFNKDGKSFYCYELCAEALKSIYSELNLRCREILKGKRVYDENTFLDEDFFEVVYDSRREE